MEYQSLDRVPPDKVVGTTAHTIAELNLSTRCGHPATGLIGAIPDAMIGSFCGVKGEGDRRLAM
jgi:hypothetical protein